jgi:hypothetical protein
VLNYFDKLFVRVYRQYQTWKEQDIPGIYALMVVSLFQAINLLFVITLIVGSQKGRDWSLSKGQLLVISLGILFFNAIRIYRSIGIEKMLTKYQNNLRLPVHPVVYFLISLALLVLTRILKMFPHIV